MAQNRKSAVGSVGPARGAELNSVTAR